ncbi:hypothetical protein ACO0LB_00495 [Undibacterium sp. SXout7W]|uniref:hypothetical protein n=1 Tax=Undibacterium sp. SXout7W TaxID=3413049 RepID=UPI003BF36DB3
MTLHSQRGISLIAVSVIFMLIGLISMGALYTMRYGHLPMQDTLNKWGKSADVIGKELKNVSGITDNNAGNNTNANNANANASGSGMRNAATVSSGVKRCTINGKTVYSDIECTDHNPTTRELKLHDTQGFVQTKPAQEQAGSDSTSEQEMRLKMLDKAINQSAR